MQKTVTRKEICDRIEALLNKKISLSEFGEEMFDYLASVGDKYMFEPGYEQEIDEALREFIDLHDANKKNLTYKPYIPSREQFLKIKKSLE